MEKSAVKWEKVSANASFGHPQLPTTGVVFVFQGASSLSLDAKGRLSVPTRHRDVLSATAGEGAEVVIAGPATIQALETGLRCVQQRPS